MWAKIKRYQDSLKSETDPNIRQDIKAIISGMTNFYAGSGKWSEIAKQRYKKFCSGCVHFIDDPVESEKIKDSTIPEISGKMCGLCGCSHPWKLRQSIKPCEYWN